MEEFNPDNITLIGNLKRILLDKNINLETFFEEDNSNDNIKSSNNNKKDSSINLFLTGVSTKNNTTTDFNNLKRSVLKSNNEDKHNNLNNTEYLNSINTKVISDKLSSNLIEENYLIAREYLLWLDHFKTYTELLPHFNSIIHSKQYQSCIKELVNVISNIKKLYFKSIRFNTTDDAFISKFKDYILDFACSEFFDILIILDNEYIHNKTKIDDIYIFDQKENKCLLNKYNSEYYKDESNVEYGYNLFFDRKYSIVVIKIEEENKYFKEKINTLKNILDKLSDVISNKSLLCMDNIIKFKIFLEENYDNCIKSMLSYK